MALFLLAVPPLFVIEFLHRIIDTFAEYFSECSEQRIKDHYVIVYEVHTLFSLAVLPLRGVVFVLCSCWRRC